MFWIKPVEPVAHFRAYVHAKVSWDEVIKGLSFQPTTRHQSLRRQSINASVENAFRRAMQLLACDLYESVFVRGHKSSLITIAGEEVIVYECLLFSASYIVTWLNPNEETYEQAVMACNTVVDDYEKMSLLRAEDLEDASIARFEFYGAKADDRESYLCTSFCRIIHYLISGEHYSAISVHLEDPPETSYLAGVLEFSLHAYKKLQDMVDLIVTREMTDDANY